MMKKIIFPLIIATVSLLNGFGQQEKDMRELFLAAESYYLFEEFNEALPLYLRIHRTYPENDNINFKIGVCFLNNPYEKDKAIPYLQDASDSISPKYKENNFKETAAPPEVMYYLGNAYLVNNQIDKARDYYHKFLDIMDNEVYDRQIVLDQLKACDAAEKLMKKPIDYDRENLSNRINTRFADMNPVISGDEKRMAFISKLQFYDAVFYTVKIDGKWSPPRNIIPELGVDGDVYPTGMSYNGDLMYIYRSDNFIGNLYYSRLVDGKWTPLIKLNENINTKYWESHATETKDGKTLYFSSNRKGGYGGLDIYRSRKKADGQWGPAVNLGPVINSQYNDDTPFITENGDKLFFSSYGHYNMGGYDVFMSKRIGDTAWAEPVNIGYPVNTTDDDQFFNPVQNGQVAYYPRYIEDGLGRTDIYRYVIYSPDNPRLFPVSGLIDYMGNHADSSEIFISVLDKSGSDTVVSVHPDPEGEFEFKVPAGSYNLIIDSDRFKKYMQELEVAQTTPYVGLSLPGTIALELKPGPLTLDEENEKLSFVDTMMVVKDGKELKVRFNAERGSDLDIRVLNENAEEIYSDSLEGTMFRQSIRFVPDPGLNEVIITLTDKDGNIVERSMKVLYDNLQEDNELTNPPADSNSTDSEQAFPDSLQDFSAQPETDTTLHDFLDLYKDKLSIYATGALKDFLNALNLKEEGITSPEELLQYLYDHADSEDYSRSDVDEMLRKALSAKDLAGFIAAMKRVSEGELRKTLEQLDPAAENLLSPRDVVDHLIDKAASAAYDPSDVIRSLSDLASAGNPNPAAFLNILMDRSENDLHDFLSNMDLNEENVETAEDLGISLYKKSENGEINQSELLDLLTDLAVAGSAESLRQKLAKNAGGSLKALLDTVDLRNNRIYTADQLIDFLYDNPYNLDYTKEDVDRLLSEQLYRSIEEIDDFRLNLAEFAEGPLKEFLKNYDVRKGEFSSIEDFIEFLKSRAETEDFTVDDINRALLRMAFRGDPDDLALRFAAHTLGDLHQMLLELDTQAEDLRTTKELIDYLLNNANLNGYTAEDVMKMLSDFSSSQEAMSFLHKLNRLAEGESKQYLQNLDPVKMGLETKQDLIDRILKDAGNGKVDEEEMISLILKAEEATVKDMLPGLKSLAPANIQQVLENLPQEITSAEALFHYLLNESENNDFSREDVLNLFSDYLKNLRLYNYLNRLRENAEGKLKDLLQELTPADEGINSTEELLRYLLKNSEKAGYSNDDVYHLVGKLIDKAELESFIQRLTNLASGGLLQALKDLDLEEQNISNIDELIDYLLSVADQYGFDPAYLWDLIARMALDKQAGVVDQNMEIEEMISHARFKRALEYAGGLLLVTGLLIFIIVLIARRRKKKEKDQQA